MFRRLGLASLMLLSSSIHAAPPAPNHIVSLSLSSDEILWQILSDRSRILSLSPLVADPRYSNIAQEKNLPQHGKTIESFVAGKADFFFISAFNQRGFFTGLEKFKIPYLKIPDLASVFAVFEMILQIGAKVQEEKSATKLVESLKSRILKIKRPDEWKENVKILCYAEGNILPGTNTLFNDVLKHAQISNVVTSTGWQKISSESLARMNPDVVLIPTDKDGKPEVSLLTLSKSPGWSSIPAIRTGRVTYAPAVLISSASQYSIDAVEAIHNAVYWSKKK